LVGLRAVILGVSGCNFAFESRVLCAVEREVTVKSLQLRGMTLLLNGTRLPLRGIGLQLGGITLSLGGIGVPVPGNTMALRRRIWRGLQVGDFELSFGKRLHPRFRTYLHF
jgi:hypothetical protein